MPGSDLAAHPHVPVRPDLALPDGHDLFYPLDGVAARLERRPAARSGDDYGDACLARVHPAQTMHYRDVPDVPATFDLHPDLLQLPVGHRAVRFVLQVLDRRALRLVDPRRAHERDYGAAVRTLDVLDQSANVQRLLDYGEHSTARDRRQDCHLVARRDAGVSARVLAVYGEGQCVAHRSEVGMPTGEQRPDLRQGYAFFYRQLGLAGPCPVGRGAEE